MSLGMEEALDSRVRAVMLNFLVAAREEVMYEPTWPPAWRGVELVEVI
jgi:hypothetical protein